MEEIKGDFSKFTKEEEVWLRAYLTYMGRENIIIEKCKTHADKAVDDFKRSFVF